MKGIDYAWGRPGGHSIKTSGYGFVCRYLSHGGKGLTASELKDLHANGLKVALVYESTAGRALEGSSAGEEDANKVVDILGTLALPTDKVVYFAVDFDMTDSQSGDVGDYFTGIANVLDVSQIGVYGGLKTVSYILDQGLATYAWQTLAWSHGKWDERGHIHQIRIDQDHINGVVVDINESVNEDFGGF